MIKNNFDKNIEDLLKGFRVEYDPSSWERLKRKLEREEEEDILFDTVIAEKLKSHAVVPPAGAFSRFERKMKGEGNIRRKLYFFASLAAALLIGLATIIYFSKKSPGGIENITSNTRVSGKNVVSPDVHTDFAKEEKEENSNFVKANTPATMSGIQAGERQNMLISPANGTATNNGIAKQNFGIYNIFNARDLLDGFEPVHLLLKNNVWDIYLDVYTDIHTVDDAVSEDKKHESPRDIAVYQNKNSGTPGLQPAVKRDTVEMIALAGNDKTVNANFFMNYNAIQVNTPNDLILQLPGYTQISHGYGGGASLSVAKGDNELELGITYNKYMYYPKKYPVQAGNSKFYMDKISYDIVGIPLAYKRKLKDNNHWNIYAKAGISANAIFNSEYRFVEENNDVNSPYSLQKFAEELQKDKNFKNTAYFQKEYKKGIMDGGKINSNFYLSLNAGFGVSHKLHDGYAVFLETKADIPFNKFGPNNDQLKTLSLKMGISKTVF